MLQREDRKLETIPVGTLGMIPLEGCRPLGEKVDYYLTKWRKEWESEHKSTLAFAGYQRDSYILDASVPRFGSGEAKGVINGYQNNCGFHRGHDSGSSTQSEDRSSDGPFR